MDNDNEKKEREVNLTFRFQVTIGIFVGLVAICVAGQMLVFHGQDNTSIIRSYLYFGAPVIFGGCILIWIVHKLKKSSFRTFMAVTWSFFAVFSTLTHALIDCSQEECNDPIWITLRVIYYYCIFTVFVQYLAVAWNRMPSKLFCILVSYPAMVFFTAHLFMMLILPIVSFTWPVIARYAFLLPFAISCGGLYQTIHHDSESKWPTVPITMTRDDVPDLRRWHRGYSSNSSLRIVQITDPHLGPAMSVEKLFRICVGAASREPDLVFLTGDFFTPVSHNDCYLSDALMPLKQLASDGKVFAVRGNHDKESRHVQVLLQRELDRVGIPLLIDESVTVNTRCGSVKVVGIDWFGWKSIKPGAAFGSPEFHVQNICEKFLHVGDSDYQIVLLHDPSLFDAVPREAGALVLSGHTHGGQIGLVSFGMKWTFLRGIMQTPDHGIWALGKNRLYVHRGQGCRSLGGNFVCRVGVPAEDSILEIGLP